MSTLGHQYDNSLVSNAFGFYVCQMNFQPGDSDADWRSLAYRLIWQRPGRAGVAAGGPAAIRRQVSTNPPRSSPFPVEF